MTASAKLYIQDSQQVPEERYNDLQERYEKLFDFLTGLRLSLREDIYKIGGIRKAESAMDAILEKVK